MDEPVIKSLHQQHRQEELRQEKLRQGSRPTQQNLYIFGKNISFSKSPHMHNAAFAHHNLTNHTYSIREVDSVSDCLPFIRSPDFKGASVTMPYKLEIAQFCDTVTTKRA
jgi:shikimate 5-dehydrogenase